MSDFWYYSERLSLNILIYYLHSCIYFINISAPGKQNVNITAPVVYTSGLNSISFYRKVRLIKDCRLHSMFYNMPIFSSAISMLLSSITLDLLMKFDLKPWHSCTPHCETASWKYGHVVKHGVESGVFFGVEFKFNIAHI
jgi:hypothetical protein